MNIICYKNHPEVDIMSMGKHFKRTSTLSSYHLGDRDLIRLFDMLRDIALIANRDLLHDSNEPFTVEDAQKIQVQIWGSRGEYFITFDPFSLRLENLPPRVDRVAIDNFSYFRMKNSVNFVKNTFYLELDLRSGDIFDLNDRPSDRSKNESKLEVAGMDSTWVAGTYSQIIDLLKSYETLNRYLHRRNVYDAFLFLFWIPGLLVTFSKQERKIFDFLQDCTPGLQALIYLCIFLVALNVFRIFFQWARWLFPMQVFSFQENRYRLILKAIFSFVALAAVSGLISNFVHF